MADVDPFDWLLRSGRLAPDVKARAIGLAARSGELLSLTLMRLGLVSEEDMAEAFCSALSLNRIGAEELDTASLSLPGISPSFLRNARVLPYAVTQDKGGSAVHLAMADPTDDQAVEAVEYFAKLAVQRVVALQTDLEGTLNRLFPEEKAEGKETVANADPSTTDLNRLRESASDAPVIRLVNALLSKAVDERGSDLHLEPTPDGLSVRLRVDGRLSSLHDAVTPRLRDAVVSRVKLMAGLDIAERRLPQDGRIAHAVRGQEIDFRVATAPTSHGETIVIRVLDRTRAKLDFASLGFDQLVSSAIVNLLAAPNGLLLVTGPTGSGKTTTLYAALNYLNTADRKLMTIEDPVEYQISGVQQVQVQPSIGLTFARALRSFLRHNPNVVMVGEIRDLETAQTAVQVALTGHLVLSTLHTNDAASGVTRLLDMGVEDYLIASTCNAFMAQRLVRTLCPHCRAPYDLSSDHAGRYGIETKTPVTLFRSVGCDKCSATGFRGRSTILEVLPVSEPIREMVLRKATASEIQQQAVREGMRTMLAHGLERVVAGATTLQEVLVATRAP